MTGVAGRPGTAADARAPAMERLRVRLAVVWPLLALALAWFGLLMPQAAAKAEVPDVVIRAMHATDTRGGGQVVLEVSRAVSFDARILVKPWRLEVIVPHATMPAGKPALQRATSLVAGARVLLVDGGARVLFRLTAPAVITDAYAERGDRGKAARLVLALARTDARTLMRLLGKDGDDDRPAEKTRAGAGKEPGAAETTAARSAGALERMKTVYRRLVEETGAPRGIGDLISALPVAFDSRELETQAAASADNTADNTVKRAAGQAARNGGGRDDADDRAGVAAGEKARPVIVVDAGHGGHDPGAMAASGVKEKDIVLKFARALRRELHRRGYKVIMTRDSDRFLRLRQRLLVARRHHARLFISVHADKFRRRGVRGLGIYTLSEHASDAEAAALARMENAADLIGAPDDLVAEDEELRDILVDLVQRETNANSLLLARELVKDLRPVTRLRRNPVRSAPFRVLRAAEIPSLLIELGYMSNPRDVRNLRSARWQARVAARMAQTIDRFLKARLAWR